MIFSRREALIGAAVALGGCGARRSAVGGRCASLAGQTIRWIVPYPPGGTYDVFSRLLEAPLEKALGAEMVIGNEPGGGALIGASKLRDARGDGRTLGILNAPGLLAAAIASGPAYPNPAHDFAILGRLSRARAILCTGARSPFRTVDDLIARQRTKPLAFALTGAGSNNLMAIVGVTRLLGIKNEFVAGYGGSREEILATMRGEVDLVSTSYETLQTSIESGDLRPILQVGARTISDHPAMQGVARLAGSEGWAAKRAAVTGLTPEEAARQAQALEDAFSAGVVVAGPKGLPSDLLACLRGGFDAAVADAQFLQAAAKAGRTLDLTDGAQALAGIEAAEKDIAHFAPAIREAIERIRK